MGDVPKSGVGGDWAERAFEAMAPLYDDFNFLPNELLVA